MRRMKKIFTLVLLLMLLCAAAVVVMLRFGLLPGYDPLYLALVGPLSKSSGQAMRQGVQFYLDAFNSQRKLGERPIRLLTFDDNDDARLAVSIAETIAADERPLVVLGHYGSSASLAAGDIYRDRGIPAITASATDSMITHRNDWYFGLVPDNTFQAEFLANYLKYALGRDAASLIAATNSYGASLAESFLGTAPKLGIEIRRQWEFDPASDRLEQELSRISTEIRTERDPGVLVVATHSAEAARILTSIQLPGANYTVLGPDTLTSDEFLDALNDAPQERESPGYSSDGVYAAAPFLVPLGDTATQYWRRAFTQTYHAEPSWAAATYHDAAQIAVEALRHAEMTERDDVWQRRRKVKQALAYINRRDIAVPGITGPLYFNQYRRVEHPLAVGRYVQQHLMPAFTQYAPQYQESAAENAPDSTVDNSIIRVGVHTMQPFQVVHAGVATNRIPRFDPRSGRYALDFYLWFRFGADFDAGRVTFTNAGEPLSLGSPVLMTDNADSATQVYRVRGNFVTSGDFRAYPFDRQALRVSFQHPDRSSQTLRYTPDIVGMNPLRDGVSTPSAPALDALDWRIVDTAAYQQTVRHAPGGSADTQAFSRFHFETLIQRRGIGMLVKPFAGVVIALIVISLAYALPATQPGAQIACAAGGLLLAAIFHWSSLTAVDASQTLLLHAVFWIVYGLGAYSLLVIALSRRLRAHGNRVARKRSFQAGRALYVVAMACAGGWLIYQWHAAHAVSGMQMPPDIPFSVEEAETRALSPLLAELRLTAYHQDDGERGVEGLRFQLDSGHVATTDAEGRAQFPSLAPCTYQVRLIEESLPETLQPVDPAIRAVDLRPQEVETLAFAFMPRAVPPTPTPEPTPTPTPTPDVTPTPEPTPIPTPTPDPNRQNCVYSVKPGDSLRQIVWQFTGSGEDLPQVMRLNRLESTRIWPGIRLSLPKRMLLSPYQECGGGLIAPTDQ